MSILKDLENKLSHLGHDTKEFCRVLNESTELNKDFTYQVPKLLAELKLPEQTFYGQEFSQFPLTLLSQNGIHLDLYHWMGANTSIHDHHFHGAFKVLRGEYVQRTYEFETAEEPLPGFAVGKLKVKEERTLAEGEVVEIHPGDKFIHETWHPSGECVTACLRIKKTTGELHSYLSPGLKISHEHFELSVSKKLDYIHFLFLNLHENESVIRILLGELPDLALLRVTFSLGVPAWALHKTMKEMALKALSERHGTKPWFHHIRSALLEMKLSST